MESSDGGGMVATSRGVLWALQWLVVFVLLQIAVQLSIALISPPETQLRLTYYAGQSNCADFSRRLHERNLHGVSYAVSSLGAADRATLCWLDLTGAVSAHDVGDNNRPLLIGIQSLEHSSGFINREFSVTHAFGDWQGVIVSAIALPLSLLWLWAWRLRHLKAPLSIRSISATGSG